MLLMSVTINERSNPHRLRHVHPVHELLLVESGSGSQLLGPQEMPCRAGELYLFPGGIPHLSYAAAQQSFTALVMDSAGWDEFPGAAGDVFAAIVAAYPAGGRLSLSPATVRQVSALLRTGLAEWLQVAPGHQACAIAAAVQAVTAIARSLAHPERRSDQAAGEHHLDLAIDYIHRNYMLPLTIADLLPLGSLGRTRFLERFTQRTGSSVGAYLTATRLGQAEHLLQQGRSLVEVALSCGFAHQSHFTRAFRAAYGRPPGAWRRLRDQAV